MSMSEKMKTRVTLPSDREILITRSFDAPRSLVWEAYTKAEHLTQWWGPEGWTLPVCEIDFRVGGSWFYCMEGPDEMKSCGKASYLEIDEPERFVMRDSFVDAEGNLLEGFPVTQNTMKFSEEDGKTTVSSITLYETKEDRDKVLEMGVEAGVAQTLDRLERLLQKLQ